MAGSRPISKKQLEQIRWKGESAFRVFSYYFTIRWNRKRLGDYVLRVLEGFAVDPDPAERRSPPTPGLPVSYSVVDLGTGGGRKSRYHLMYNDERLLASDQPGEVLEHLFWHINSETFRGTPGFLLIHAGSVVAPSGMGVLLPGTSGAGKSTLTTALVRSGFKYLSDEAGAIDPVSRRIYPYPKAISLKKPAGRRFGLFDELRARGNGAYYIKRQWHLRPEEIRPGALGAPSKVGLIVLPRYEQGIDTTVQPISSAEAAFELAQNGLNLARYGSRALPLLADVARGAQSFRLASGHLEEAVRVIMDLTREGALAEGPEALTP